jgi:tetratricopeptide (TPR) repeat protein
MLDTVVFVDSKIIDFFTNEMILVQLHAEKKDTLLAQQYCASAFPMLILMDKDGKEIDRVAGYLPTDEFLKTFRDYKNGIGTIADMVAKSKDSTSREYTLQIADRYKYSCNKAAAELWYNKVIAAGSPTDSVSAQCKMEIADMYARDKRYDEAISIYQKMIVDFKDKPQADEAILAIPGVYSRAKDYQKALAEYQKISEEYKGKSVARDADYYIGSIYARRLNDTAKAITTFENWLTKYPDADSTDVQQIKGIINRLKNPPAPKPEEKKK